MIVRTGPGNFREPPPLFLLTIACTGWRCAGLVVGDAGGKASPSGSASLFPLRPHRCLRLGYCGICRSSCPLHLVSLNFACKATGLAHVCLCDCRACGCPCLSLCAHGCSSPWLVGATLVRASLLVLRCDLALVVRAVARLWPLPWCWHFVAGLGTARWVGKGWLGFAHAASYGSCRFCAALTTLVAPLSPAPHEACLWLILALMPPMLWLHRGWSVVAACVQCGG